MKFYLTYPDVTLLGQHVNSLGLLTSEKKLKALRLLKYPKIEYYLGLTRYLRSYIHYYAQLASLL